MTIQNTVAYQYAKWGCKKANKKTGKYVKLQEKKWLKIADGKVKDVWIDEDELRLYNIHFHNSHLKILHIQLVG